MSANGASNVVVLTSSEQAVTQNALNFSLLKTNTILQGIAGAFITATVVISVVVGVAVFSSTVKYDYPEVRDDFITTYKVTPVKIYVLDNDKDIRQGNLTIQSVTQPTYGTVRIVDSTYVIYTPNKYYAGHDYFNYTAQNDKLASTAAVTVLVLNHAPDVVPQHYMINKNSKNNKADIFNYKTEAGLKVSDLDDDKLVVSGATSPSFGAVTFDDNFVYYTPARDFNGIDTCNYTVSDGNTTATHILTFEVFNSPPVANPDTFDVPKNTFQTFDVLKNDVDINDDALNITACGSTKRGKCSVSDDAKTVTYTPDYTTGTTTDSFEYKITDGGVDSKGQLLTDQTFVIVNLLNKPPQASPVTLTFPKNSKATFPVDLSSKYSDSDEVEQLALSIVPKGTVKGAMTVTRVRDRNKFVLYANQLRLKTYPDSDPWFDYQVAYTLGTDSYIDVFDYTVTDTGGLTATSTITVSIGNLPPVAPDVTLSVPKRGSGSVDVLSGVTDPNGDAVTLSSIQNPVSGSAVKFNGTHAKYTAPQDGSIKTDTFTYTVCDTEGGCSTGNVFVTIFNQPPTPNDDGPYTVAKGLSLDITDLLANDVDPNQDEVFIRGVSNTTNGGFVVKKGTANKVVTYTALNALYNDAFTYDIVDVEGLEGTGKATVSIVVVNTPPVAVDDSATTLWNRSVEIVVTNNDQDANPGDAALLTVASVTQPQFGSVTFDGKKVVYTPQPGFVGTDTFTYKCKDQFDASANSAVVTVQVNNNAPVANPDTFSKHHLTQNVLIDVLANDNDPDNDAIVLVSTNNPRAQVVVSNGKQMIQYSSIAGSLATESFTYTISDYNKQASATVTVTITDDAPVANPDYLTVHWRDTSAKSVSVVDNDSDPNGDPITLTSTLTPSAGFIGTANVAGQSIVFTAPGNAVKAQSVAYTITDGALSATGTLFINVTNLDVPTASDKSFVQHWRTQLTAGTSITLLDKSQDSDGDTLVLTFSQPSGGNFVTKVDSATLKYQRMGFKGTDNFGYTVSDGLATASAQVSVTVYNNPPTAKNISAFISGDKFSTGIDIDLISGAGDADSEDSLAGLTISQVGTAPNGVVTPIAGGAHYKPSSAFTTAGGGVDVFTYQVSDGMDTTTGYVFVTVPFVDPSEQSVYFDIHWSKQVGGSVLNLGQQLVSVHQNPAQGTLSNFNSPAQTVRYTQTPNYLGSDVFVVNYDNGVIQTNKLRTYVNVYDKPPVAQAFTFNTHWRSLLSGVAYNVMAGATDADPEDTVSLVSATNGARGTATKTSATQVTYTATTAFLGPAKDTFTYTVTDGLLSATQSVTIIPTNNAKPVATPKYVEIHWRALTQAGTQIDILTQATDADGDTLTISAGQTSAGGQVSKVNGNMSFRFTHNNFVGVETFSYTVSDGIETATSTVTVNVTNLAPTAVDDTYLNVHWSTAIAGLVLTPSPLANDLANDGDTLSISSFSPTTTFGGSVTAAAGSLRFTGVKRTGTDTFSYTITDGFATSTARVNVQVTNGAPVASPAARSVHWKGTVQLNPQCSDPNSDPFTITIGTASKGTITNGVYTPTTSNLGLTFNSATGRHETTDTISFTCSDSVDASTNNIVVTIFDNAPVAVADSYTFARRRGFSTTLNVLANDYDVDTNDAITLTTSLSANRGAQVTIQGSNIAYTPVFSTVGAEVVTYSITDGIVTTTGQATVTMTNDAPVCTPLTESINKGQTRKAYVLAPCTDANGDTLTVVSYGAATKGTFTISSDTSGPFIVYTPNPKRSGTDTITYTVSDGITQVTNTLTITIANNAPVVPGPQTLSVSANSQDKSFSLTPMTGVTDPDTGDSVSLQSISAGTCGANTGTLTRNGQGVTYVYKGGWSGTCTFQFTVTDDDQDNPRTTTGSYVIVASLGDPVAIDDRFEVNQGSVFSIPASTLLLNDYDLSNFTLTFDGLDCDYTTTCTNPNKLPSFDGTYITIPADSTTCTTLRYGYKIKSSVGRTAKASFYVKYINCKCYNPADIVYIIDGSSSITDANWVNTKNFLKALTSKLVVGSDKIRIGAVQFSDGATYANSYGFTFQWSSTTSINTLIDGIRQLDSWTGTIAGLDLAVSLAGNSNLGARSGVAKTYILLTDGAPNRPCSCTACQNYYGSQSKCNSPNYPGLTCSNCKWDTQSWCMPCADPRPRAQQINASQNPKSKIITVAVGTDITDLGYSIIRGCAYDASASFAVDWNQLDTIVSKIIDESCQS
jgi:hypothetical protein